MHNRFKLILISVILSLAWMSPVQAQDEADGNISRLAMIKAKAGHEGELVDAITEYHKWVAQFEGHHQYQWYEVLTGPHTGMYMARTPNHKWADFDASYDWQKQAGEMFDKTVQPHIEKVEIQFASEMEEYTHWPESWDGYSHFSVTDWYVHNGHGAKFRQGLKKIVDALVAGGYPGYWGFFSIESGGKGNQIRIVGANKGWADMGEKDPSFSKIMTEAMGGEEELRAFMADWSSTFKPGLNQMLKYMPGASDYGTE